MKIYFLIVGIFFLSSFDLFAQKEIDIIESTFKLKANSEEILYYGFAKGDQIIFNFSELDNKEIKEIEIAEYPSNSKFIDYKSSSVLNKAVNVNKTAIYMFRFSNSSISGRVCKVKIQRIPESTKTLNFNTTVFWRNASDSVCTNKTEKYLVKSDTSVISLVDQITKISSRNAINGNSNNTVVEFTLPESTVFWSYYIGVGKEGNDAFNKAKDKFLTTAIAVASKFSGYGTLAALALYGVNTFTQVQGGDNVKYFFINDKINLQLFNDKKMFNSLKKGDVVSDAAQMKTPLKGSFFIGLTNDNLIEPIEVIIKVTAITVKQEWGTRNVVEYKENGKREPFLKN